MKRRSARGGACAVPDLPHVAGVTLSRRRFSGLTFFVAALAPLAAPAEPAVVQAMLLAREADRAAEAKDLPAWLEKCAAAVALRPDIPRFLVALAGAQAANDRPEEAIATLARLAALGLHAAIEPAAEFATLRDRPEFTAAVRKLAANLRPSGPGEIAFSLRDMTGLIEGIAWRAKTGEFFFGDVHGRTVWVRSRDDKVRRFTDADDAILGVFGLAVDEANGALWAATSAVSAMEGYSPGFAGMAGVAEFDLASGALRRVVLAPKETSPHLIGDLALAPDGSIYLPDSGAPILWRLAPGADTLERFVETEEFISLQGAVITRDGGALVVADRINGLLRIDLRTRSVQLLPPPPDTTLIGLDGLTLAPNGDLLALQNTTTPKRVLRLGLEADASAVTRVDVLDSGHLNLAAPSLGCVATDGDFFFIANPGWNRFEGGGGPSAPRPVAIFRTKP